MKTNTLAMEVKTVRASPKGQLTLPKAIYDALGLHGATDFVVVQEGRRIILIPAEEVARQAADDLAGWELLSEAAFAEVWDNPEDEVWNDL